MLHRSTTLWKIIRHLLNYKQTPLNSRYLRIYLVIAQESLLLTFVCFRTYSILMSDPFLLKVRYMADLRVHVSGTNRHVRRQHVLFLFRNRHIHDMINDILTEMVSESRTCSHVAELTSEIHVYPDYHGNRSPIADPTLRGMVSTDYTFAQFLCQSTVQCRCTCV